MLGITGKRLFNPFIPRLTGLGVSKTPSLQNHSVSKPGRGAIHRWKCSYLGSLLPSISGAESSCRVFKNRFNPAVTATSFSLSDIEGAILDSESSNAPRRGCRKGLPATFKIWSLLISESPRGRSSRRFCITDKTRRELRFLISSGR